MSVRESYVGVGFQYQGNIESVPLVRDIGGLEYEISSIIKRLTAGKKKVAFSQGHGEPILPEVSRTGTGFVQGVAQQAFGFPGVAERTE